MRSQKQRVKSAHPRNYNNVELHACLDEAKEFQVYVLQLSQASRIALPEKSVLKSCTQLSRKVLLQVKHHSQAQLQRHFFQQKNQNQ